MDADRRDLLERENHLLQGLEGVLATDDLDLAVPHVVPSSSGTLVVEVGAWRCRATAHLEGERPDGGSERTYVTAARTLSRLHSVVSVVPRTSALFGRSSPRPRKELSVL